LQVDTPAQTRDLAYRRFKRDVESAPTTGAETG